MEELGVLGRKKLNALALRKLLFEHKPNELYRYRSGHSQDIEALREGYEWLSSPDDYNDPFDSRMFHSFGAVSVPVVNKQINDNPIIMAKLKPLIGDDKFDVFGERADKQLFEKSKKYLGPLFEAYKSDCIKLGEIFADFSDKTEASFEGKVRAVSKICSFTTNFDNRLMWAHYSKSHKGYCLEYEFEDPYYQNGFILPVYYQDEPLDMTDLLVRAGGGEKGAHFSVVFGSALIKSKPWEYEKEWRYIAMSKDNNRKLKGMKLKRVILGCNVEQELEARVKDICKLRNVELVKQRRSLDSFDIITD